MRTAACVFYVICIFVYFVFDFGKDWGVFYMVTQCLAIAYLCHLQIENKRHTETEQLLFLAVKYLCLADAVYTFLCMLHGKDYAIRNTNAFAYLMVAGFVVILVHIAYNKDKYK